jgi:lipid-A-disaccharide synthase
MGLVEVLPRLPHLIRRLQQATEAVASLRPDVVVTIDSPGFTFRLARRLRGLGIPVVHYVAPSVWAWRPGRAAKMVGLFDHLMALLPFETPYFEAVGLPCSFVGHPVLESGADQADGAAFRHRHGIAGDVPVLVCLPGSRHSETARLLPVFAETVRRLVVDRPTLRLVVPTVETVAEAVGAAVAKWPGRPVVVTEESARYGAFAAADAALAASGTVALELALAGTPTVIAYRVNALTAWLARRLIKVRYANLINIALGWEAVPERLQEACRPDFLADDIGKLLDDENARSAQAGGVVEALRLLGRNDESPSRRAARTVLAVLDARASSV